MVFSVPNLNKLLTICCIVVLSGCANKPIPMSAPPKPFKVCSEESKEEDQPCVKLGPTNSPVDRGGLNNTHIYALKYSK